MNSGLEALHYLTRENRNASFYLKDRDGEVRTANYTNFQVHTSSQNYALQVSTAVFLNRKRAITA